MHAQIVLGPRKLIYFRAGFQSESNPAQHHGAIFRAMTVSTATRLVITPIYNTVLVWVKTNRYCDQRRLDATPLHAGLKVILHEAMIYLQVYNPL
jgi:hypothetical protein